MWRRALAVLVVSACQGQGGCLLGENANLRFSYLANTVQCQEVCGVLYPIMTGSTVKMRARGTIPERDFSVRADRENVIVFTKIEETVEPTDQEERVTILYTAEALVAGLTKVVLNSGGDDVDTLGIYSADPATVEVTPGVGEVSATVRDANGRELIFGEGSLTALSSNPSVLTVTPVAGTSAYFTVNVVSPGTATVTVRAGEVEGSTDITVP